MDKLRAHPLFAGSNDDGYAAALAALCHRRRVYAKGEYVKRADETMDFFGIVEDGLVQVYYENPDGTRAMMANVEPGESFGESIAYLGQEPLPVTVVAAADTTLSLFSPAALRSPSTPEIAALAERFTAHLARRTLAMNDRIQILSKPSLRQKLLAYFARCSHRAHGKTFRVPFDRESFAAYLGCDRSALSRELSRMKQEGLIDYFKNDFRLLY